MSNFVVSARKYRPKRFREIKGQDHIVETIQNAIKSNQVASAFLLCGLLGSGKTSLARILARALNCDQPSQEGEPCLTCHSCKQKSPLNIHELDAASNNSAEDMRKIVEQIRYRPTSGKKMIIIIDESHMLSNAALNVLLKPLEDTPPHVVFILVTTEKHKIIPTILSRCQVFDFHAISIDNIQQQLKEIAQQENILYEEEALKLISEKANGSLRNALSMFDLIVTFSGNNTISYALTLRHLNLLDTSVYFTMTEALYTGNTAKALLEYDQILHTGFDSLFFITGLGEHLRNLLVAQNTNTFSILQVTAKEEVLYQEKAKQIEPTFIYQALEIIQHCELNYKQSAHHRLHIEITLVRLSQLRSQNSLKYIPQQTVSPPELASSSSQPSTIPQPKKIEQPAISTIATPSPKKKQAYKTDETLTSTLMVAEPSSPRYRTKKKTITIPSRAELKEKETALDKSNKKVALTINKANVITCLRQYLEKLKNKKQHHHALLHSTNLSVHNRQIFITLTSPEQQLALEEIKEALLSHLQISFNDQQLSIVYSIAPQKEKQPYTDQEKLDDLIGKYKQVNYLQNQLNLVAEY